MMHFNMFRNLLCADMVNTIFGMATAYSLVDDKDKKNDIKKVRMKFYKIEDHLHKVEK